ASKPGYDVIAQGMGGLTYVTGEPNQAPVKAGFSIADIGTGMWAVIGILNAIVARTMTGKGQWVDCSLIDTMISWQTYLAGNFFGSGENPKPQGGAHPNIVPYQLFDSSDGYFNIAVGNENLWKRFCHTLNESELIDHPKYAKNSDRVQNRKQLVGYLQTIFKSKTAKEWVDIFEKAGIPCGPVLNFDEIYTDQHVLAREQLIEMEHPSAGKIKMTGIPIKLSDTPGSVKTPPPLLGQHTKEILKKINNLNEDQIVNLEKSGVIKCSPLTSDLAN